MNSKTKLTRTKPEHVKVAEKLYAEGYSVVNIGIYYNELCERKCFFTPPNVYSLSYEECSDFIGTKWKHPTLDKICNTTGIMLLTGTRKGEREDLKHCVCIDFDNPKDDEINGLEFLKSNNKLFKKTYIETSASGGKHYIYSFNPEDFNKKEIYSSKCTNGVRFTDSDEAYSMDILCNGNAVIIAPSSFIKHGDKVKYNTDCNLIDDIQSISKKLMEKLSIIEYCSKNKKSNKKDKKDKDEDNENMERDFIFNKENYEPKPKDDELTTLLKMGCKLGMMKKYPSKFPDWSKLGLLIKNEYGDDGFELFHWVSYNMNNYNGIKDCRDYYNKFNDTYVKGKRMTIASIIYEFKKIDKDLYGQIKKESKGLNIDITKIEFDKNKLKKFDGIYFHSFKEYEERKHYFEHFICKVLRPKCCYIYTEYDIDNLNKLLYTEKEIKETFKHLKSAIFNRDGEEKQFIDIWLNDSNARVANELEFTPYNGVSDIDKPTQQIERLNIFSGFNKAINTDLKDIDKEKMLKPFKDILFELVGAKKENYEYFINKCAHMIQYPNERDQTAIIITGPEGTGKGVILNALARVINQHHYISSSKITDFFGEHAMGFYRKLLINMNETEGKDTLDYEGIMKTCITEEYLTCNPKHLQPIKFKNYVRVIITTNKTNPVKIDTSKGARRWVVFGCTEKYKGKEYNSFFWKKIVNLFNSDIFTACLYDYLNRIDLSKFKLSKRPITDEFRNMASRSIADYIQFTEQYINKLIYDKKTGFINDIINKNPYKILCSDYYNLYLNYLDTECAGENRHISNKKFVADILSDKNLGFIKKTIKGYGYYEFTPEITIDKLKKAGLLMDEPYEFEEDEDEDDEDKDIFEYFG